MAETFKLRLASALYKNAFPLYRLLYFNFKRNKDRYNTRLIRKLVKPGSKVLDIGANIGFYGRFLSECAGAQGHVYCFEPDTINFRHLQNELKNCSNVTLIQKAVAATSGTLSVYTSKLLNVDHRTYEPDMYSGKYSVDKTSIDHFVKGEFKVDFIKMDIQGFEMDALRGMKETIAANPDLVIVTEFWPYGLSSAGSSATQLYDYVTDLGFNVFQIGRDTTELMSREVAADMKVEYFTDADVVLSRNDISSY
jgi:FkbM family methyltransferase